MARKFHDNSTAPIMGMDFDGTICMGRSYPDPHNGELRPYAKEVMNFLHEIGVKVVIWTSRDVAIDQEEMKIHDYITPVIEFLQHHEVKYCAINKSIQFAPYEYQSRKIYTHMYVDDRAYGWDGDDHLIMVKVLKSFMIKVIGIDNKQLVGDVIACIKRGKSVNKKYIERCKEYVKGW